ncbi:MAG: LLM class flavin-dependent oxidoreductase [Gammaproteobacteria bacterium]|nr:LLM class flavin-dependent oxidoreductase [Gammaproteobacteria bacterium]MBT8443591.1 LLM class flavin-dependent oxidoreductase [Gammaproteobacteria bacterium]NND36218.1 LLM class flavin-dependent oxidoreductase [Gammaproteobacteria bacterium]
MRIDVILESNNSPETVLRLGRLAEECGLGGVWVSNMNDARDPFINFVQLGLATRRIRVGPIAVSPFELHPLKMTSSLLTLNEVTGGRAQIVVGAGGGTASAMDAKPHRIVRAVRECVEIIKAGATGKPVQYRGELFRVRWYDATWATSAPPLVYVGANGPQMLRSAARYADGVMVSDFVIDRVRWAREIIDRSLEECGRDPAAFPMSNFWAWHVKDSAEEALREARVWLAVRGTIYDKYLGDILAGDEKKIVADNVDAFIRAYQKKSPDIEGVPDEIADKVARRCTSASPTAEIDREIARLRQFRDAGLTEIALRIYDEPDKSIRLIGEKVVPALRQD